MAWMGALIAGAMSYIGQSETNDQNMSISQANSAFNADQAGLSREFNASEARMQRDWSADQSDKARDYMTSMSNTSYQRAIADMKAAGLNPMLAYSQGGASTPASSAPSGAAASGPSASAAANPVIGNKNLAGIAGAQAALQQENLRAQTKKTEAETDLTRAQIPRTEQETRTGAASEQHLTASAENLRKETDLREEQIHLVRRQIELAIREYRLKGIQIMKLEQEVFNAVKTGKHIDADTSLLHTKDQLEKLLIPAAKNAAKYEEGPMGGIRPYLKDAATAAGSAARLFRLGR